MPREPQQPMSPFPACLCCVVNHRLKDVFTTTALYPEGLSMVEMSFKPRKTR